MKNILLTLLMVVQPMIAGPVAADAPVEPEFKAIPRITINREQAGKEGVSILDLNKQVQAYFEARDQFTLDELKALEIPTRDGKTVKLSQVAGIEVTFLKAPRKAPAESAGSGQPATSPVVEPEG